MFGRSRRLAKLRRGFAEELREACNLRSEALVDALATVERERFLPSGPWLALDTPDGYVSTPDDDPAHLYRNIAIGIEPARLLNNSQPSLLAEIIDALDIEPGQRVVHLGCATGYYTAILAHLVGKRGSVTAVEIDPKIHAQARRALRGYRHVELVHADALEYDPGLADAILVDGGITHPMPIWLDCLRPGGRMALLLTAARPPSRLRISRLLRNDLGRVLVVEARPRGLAARFSVGVGVAALYGAKDPERQRILEAAYARGGHEEVRSVRREPHEVEPNCWFHSDGFCLSTREIPA